MQRYVTCNNGRHHTNIQVARQAAQAHRSLLVLVSRPLFPSLGNSFATVGAACRLAVKPQLAVPHAYPVGQHPAIGPASVPHRYQPPAHLGLVEAGMLVMGTATVSPLEMIVVKGGGGHEVV
jgi:hypothetical protein